MISPILNGRKGTAPLKHSHAGLMIQAAKSSPTSATCLLLLLLRNFYRSGLAMSISNLKARKHSMTYFTHRPQRTASTSSASSYRILTLVQSARFQTFPTIRYDGVTSIISAMVMLSKVRTQARLHCHPVRQSVVHGEIRTSTLADN